MTEYQREQFPIPTPGRLRRELRLRRPPWWMVLALIVVIIATWIPLYLIYQQRNSYSTLPKIHTSRTWTTNPDLARRLRQHYLPMAEQPEHSSRARLPGAICVKTVITFEGITT